MYFYFYDSFLNDKKYERILADIESRLLDLGISGKNGKLTILKNPKELIEDGIKMGAKTVVAIGDDETVSKVIKIIAPYDVILGHIPLGSSLKFAEILGIPEGQKACDVLSARIIDKIDLGKINEHYFFSAVEIPPSRVKLECDGRYQVMCQEENVTLISNLGNLFNSAVQKTFANPKDGILETSIYSLKKSAFPLSGIFKKGREKSFFPIKKIKIISDRGEIPLFADGFRILTTPALVEVVPKKLKVVVGKNRAF